MPLLQPFDAAIMQTVRQMIGSGGLQLMKRVPIFMPDARRAAVLVPLCNDQGIPRSVGVAYDA
jgi:hypothetical protein